MNNPRYKQEKKLFKLYHDTIHSDDIKKLIEFLRKYISVYEDDNSLLKNTFLLLNPLEDIEEIIRYVQTYYKKITDLLLRFASDHEKHRNKSFRTVISYLGFSYEHSLFGLNKNNNFAVKFYKRSAQLNCPFGTLKLAQCYEKGVGTEKDLTKALYFYRCAAKLSSIEALHTFGTILLQNNNLEEIYSEDTAIFYLKLSTQKAHNGYPYPWYDFARYLEHKVVNEKEVFETEYCFETYLKGARLDCPNCHYRIGLCFENGELGKAINIQEAIKWFKSAAYHGNTEAQVKISQYILKDTDMYRSNQELAFKYALKAASKENCVGAKFVSLFYKRGIGVKKNENLYKFWNSIYEEFSKIQNIIVDDNLIQGINSINVNDEEPVLEQYITSGYVKAL